MRARLLAIAVSGAALTGLADQTTFAARGDATRSAVYAQNGMVCAAQPLAVQAGLEILKEGGSAVDAAIATNACLGLMEPTANGLGGDLFAIVWDPKTAKLAGLNGSGLLTVNPPWQLEEDLRLVLPALHASLAAGTAGRTRVERIAGE